MGLLARGEGDDEQGIELDASGQKLFLESCRVCATPLALLGEPPADGPICDACARSAR